jgi:hypothetical protein
MLFQMRSNFQIKGDKLKLVFLIFKKIIKKVHKQEKN